MCEYSLSSEKGDGLRPYNQEHNRYEHTALPERQMQSTNPRSVASTDAPHGRDVGAEGEGRSGNHLFIPQYQGHRGVQEQYSVEVQDSSQRPDCGVDEPHRTVVEIHQDQPPTSSSPPSWPQDIWLHNESCRVLYQPVLVFPHPQPGCPPPRPINPEQQPQLMYEVEAAPPLQASHQLGPDSLVTAAPQPRDEPEDQKP